MEKLNRIKVVLAEKDVAGKELAEKLGVNAVTVSRWINNVFQPELKMLYRIANALNVNVCDLLVNNEGMTEEVTDDK